VALWTTLGGSGWGYLSWGCREFIIDDSRRLYDWCVELSLRCYVREVVRCFLHICHQFVAVMDWCGRHTAEKVFLS
jgi:hypothetical protein